MAYYIDIECLNCHHKFKVDGAIYANKKISFNCKNCGNKISYFVPPGYDGLSAPKSEISTTKVKKVKEVKKKEQKSDLPSSTGMNSMDSEGLKIKLPSIFKKKVGDEHINEIQNKPVTDAAKGSRIIAERLKSKDKRSTNLPIRPASDAAITNDVKNIDQNLDVNGIQNIKQPSSTAIQNEMYLSPKVADFEATGEAEIPDFLVNKPKIQTQPPATQHPSNEDFDKSMVHIPKPGMPFIAQISTPTFYKAGSYKRKDYSFIIAELSKFRSALGKTSRQNSLAFFKAAISSEQNKDDIPSNVVDEVGEEAYATSIDQLSEPAAAIPLQQSQSFNPPAYQDTSGDIGIKQPVAMEQPIATQSAPQILIPDFQPLLNNKEIFPDEKKAPVPDPAKIVIPLNLNQFKEQAIQPPPQAKPVAPRFEINTENEKWEIPEVEIVDDQFTSVMQPAQTQPSNIFGKQESRVDNLSTPSTGAVFIQDRPGIIHKSQERITPVTVPQSSQVQSPIDFQKNIQIPTFNDQNGNFNIRPSIPLYSTEPPQQMNTPTPVFQPGGNAAIPNSQQTNTPFQVPFNQQQSYGIDQGFPNQSAPVSTQEQAVTQRMPAFQQGVPTERPIINLPGIVNPQFPQEPVAQRMPVSQQSVSPDRPVINPPGVMNPVSSQEEAASYQQQFQQQANIADSIPLYQRPPRYPVQPQTIPPVRSVNTNEMNPVVQNPPEPIPPPSVTSPMITGSVKKPIIDEDDEEQFGPSNFGLDF